MSIGNILLRVSNKVETSIIFNDKKSFTIGKKEKVSKIEEKMKKKGTFLISFELVLSSYLQVKLVFLNISWN